MRVCSIWRRGQRAGDAQGGRPWGGGPGLAAAPSRQCERAAGDVATGAIEVACSSLEIIFGVENIFPNYREDPMAGTQCEIKSISKPAYAHLIWVI